MDYTDCLTNEQLLKRFKNQFELVRYAIKLAESEIKSGRDAYGPIDSDNVAHRVLSDIVAGQDFLIEDEEEEEIIEEEPVMVEAPKKGKSKTKAAR
jgi:DNA-directed RNA polymerase subunit omega